MTIQGEIGQLTTDYLRDYTAMVLAGVKVRPNEQARTLLRALSSKGLVVQRELESHEDNYGSYPFEYEPLIEEQSEASK